MTVKAPNGSRTRALIRAAGMIAVVTILARIAGFIRYLVFGASVGAGDVGTAYSSANLVPNVLFEAAAGGALAGMVIPLIAGMEITASRRADRIISALLTWTLIITAVLAGLVIAFAHPISEFVFAQGSSSLSTAGVDLGARLLRVFALQLPLYGITIVLGAFLQARKRFFWPAFVPLVSSLMVMATYAAYAASVPPAVSVATLPPGGEFWLGWGTTLGVAAMALPLIIPSLKAGLRYRPTLTLPRGVTRHALGLAAAGMTAVLAQQAVTALVLILAVRAGGSGTLPLFQYGQAVYLLPYAILLVPIMTTVFPTLSESRLDGDKAELSRLALGSMLSITALAGVGGAALWGASVGLERFFTAIDRTGVVGVGAVTAAFAIGLIPFGVVMHSIRVLNAALKSREALMVGAVPWLCAGLLITFTVLTSSTRTASEAAVLFAFSIAIGQIVGAVSAITVLREHTLAPEDGAAMMRGTATAAMASIVASVGGYFGGRAAEPMMTGAATAALLGAVIGVAAGAACLGLIAVLDPARARAVIGIAGSLLPGRRAERTADESA